MTRHFAPPDGSAALPASMLIEAIRCWHEARMKGESIQPCLSRMLEKHEAVMLTPVLDSLIHLYEIGLGRPIQVGDGLHISNDEHLLFDLIAGHFSREVCLACDKDIVTALDCAISSIRVLMAPSVQPHSP
jgi:hypothetical protein